MSIMDPTDRKGKIQPLTMCQKRGKHDWYVLFETYHWKHVHCRDCAATKKVRPKGW